jgi:hypothetical protein
VAPGGRALAPVDPAIRVAQRAAGGGEPAFGERDGALLVQAPGADADLAVLAFDERAAGIDRLRARALAVPGHLLEGEAELRPAQAAPLRFAARVAALGGDPVDPDPETEERVLAELEATGAVPRPHEDPDPSRRIARRILQRLDGMGKWGGYHTAFDHLARGFPGHERALAEEIGEALLRAGLLREKRSVGQRHVFLDPSRAADVRALIDEGRSPPNLTI